MSKNETVATEEEAAEIELQAPEVGTLWKGNLEPLRIEHIAECDGETIIKVGQFFYFLDDFHETFRPYTILSTATPDPTTAIIASVTDVLATEYETALTAEAIARLALDGAKAELSVIEADVREGAREAGRIDGPNAEARKDQALLAVISTPIARSHIAMIAKFERDYADAKVAREAAEMRCKLYRAWLNSQSGSH